MSLRRSFFFAVLAVLSLTPFLIYAQTAQPTQITRQVSSDICLDESISMNPQGKVSIKTGDKNSAQYKTCDKMAGGCSWQKEKAKLCACGKVTFTDFTGKAVKTPVSKCDPDLKKKMSDASSSNIKDLALRLSAAQALSTDIKVGTTEGNQKLAQALINLGATPADAQAAVAQDPQKAYDLLQKTVAGDSSGAAQLATELNLNSDVKNKIASLQPSDFPDVLKGAVTSQSKQQLDNLVSAPITGFPYTPANALRFNAPLPQLGANDQIRAISGSMCERYAIQDCKSFSNGMIATFYQECGGKPNCLGHASSYAGSFALSSTEYVKGIQAFLNSCDTSDVCQYVGNNCTGDGRGIHMCNVAAAVANHARIGAGIEVVTNNPYQQAAMHMMYQLMPSQTVAALASSDPNAIWGMTLNSASLSALCSNKICLPPGARGADAVNAIMGSYGTLAKGVLVATNGAAGPVPTSAYAASPFGGFFSSGQTTAYGAPYRGSPFASLSPVSIGSSSASPNASIPVSARLPSSQQTPTSTVRTAPPPEPVATLLLQPETLVHGNPLTVSWSSVGTRTDAPCRVLVTASSTPVLFASGNEGTKVVTPKSSGQLRFTLQCNGLNGKALQREATAVVN